MSYRSVLVALLLGVCGFSGIARLTGQSVDSPRTEVTAASAPAEHVHPDMTLPIVVDGQVTPEKISDNLAYQHFILVAGPPLGEESTDAAEARRGLMRQIGLNLSDEIAFGSYVKSVKAELTQLTEAKHQTSELGGGDTQFFRERERELVSSARAGLQQTLSPAGAARVDAYVTKVVKRHIVIYGADVQ